MAAVGVERIELLMRACGGAQGDFNLQTHEVRFSASWLSMLGYRPEDLAPLDLTRWDGLCHHEDLPQVRAERERLLSDGGERFEVEARMRHREGGWRFIHVGAVVMSRDALGRPAWLIAVQTDRTEQRRQEQHWHARADMSADWFWQTDAQHRVSRFEAGPRWGDPQSQARFLGLRRDEFQGIEPPPGGWAAFYEVLDRHLPFKGLGYALLAPDGSTQMWVEIDGRPVFDAANRFVGYEGVGRDVSESQRSALALRQSLELVDSLFESIPMSVAQKDLFSRYTRVNRAFCDLFEVTPADILGRGSAALMDLATSQLHDAADRQLIAMGQGRLLYEARQALRSGVVIDTLVTKSLMKDAQGRTTGLVTSVADVSEMKRVERDLAEAKAAAEEASEAKSTFLSTMSHEIRTPINGIMGMAELLARSGLDNEQRRMVDVILDSGRGLLQVIDGVLDFSKVEAGKLEFDTEPVHLEALVESVCDALEPLALQKHVALRPCVSREAQVAVMVDPTRLRQILLNLIGNAIKFGAGSAQTPLSVWIHVTHAERWTRLSIIDEGIGMDSEQQARLFSPFTQGDSSTTRRYGGTGLGLAICKRLVEAQGGRIALHSAAGEGARVDVWLPLPECEQPVPPAHAPLDGVTCLLLDGPEANPNHGLQQWLHDAGAAVCLLGHVSELPALVRGLPGPLVLVLVSPETLDPHRGHLLDGCPVVSLRPERGPASATTLPVHHIATRWRRRSVIEAVARAAGRPSADRQQSLSSMAQPLTLGPPRRVLVAEDEPTNQLVIQRQLELMGCEVVVAGDGELAMRLWRDGDFDLLLTDLHMPTIDGFELAAAIRREERAGRRSTRIPILALTASVLATEARLASQAGIDECLTKPIQMSVLQDTIRRLTEQTSWTAAAE